MRSRRQRLCACAVGRDDAACIGGVIGGSPIGVGGVCVGSSIGGVGGIGWSGSGGSG
jgi:hypothetical protein